MMLEIFQNGSDKVNRRLLLFEFACDAYILTAGMILASLAIAQDTDWAKSIPSHGLWFGLAGFFLGASTAFVKGAQMFFSKAATLYKEVKDNNGKTNE
jgi:hypothetical protein